MDIVDAAKLLHTRLLPSLWLTAIGVGTHDGRPAIIVYVTQHKKTELAFIRDGWQGFPVVIKISGNPRAVVYPFAQRQGPFDMSTVAISRSLR